jgi:L-threonylcarbamoyladenylate synthase
VLEPVTPETIARAAELLRGGGVVAFPTETVYGLGARAFDPVAVARIFEIKERPQFDPLVVHLADRAMLESVVTRVPQSARTLIERFWPGALTLVLEKTPRVPGIVTGGLPTVAVRMPSHPAARALLEALGEPLAAPSANPFGRLSPTRAEHVAQGLADRVDLILDGGPSTLGVESTIVAFDPEPVLLRPGAVSLEELEAVVGPLSTDLRVKTVRSPGQLPVHYAPRTPLRIVEPAGVALADRAVAGVLTLRESFDGYAAQRVLSKSGDLRVAAASLFEALHDLDALALQRIDAQPFPERDLGRAIMDRLRRAASR